jgi:hypothetical protein
VCYRQVDIEVQEKTQLRSKIRTLEKKVEELEVELRLVRARMSDVERKEG